MHAAVTDHIGLVLYQALTHLVLFFFVLMFFGMA